MGDVKWIKITVDMFDNPKIKYIRTMPDGDRMLLIWIAVLTMAGRCNSGGMLILADTIPYSPKMIADEFGFEENTVQLALNLFAKLHMVETSDGTILIPGWSEYQSVDRLEEMKEKDRLRKREERAKLKLVEECPRTVHGQSTDESTDGPRIPLTLISNSLSNSFKHSNSNIENLKYILTLNDKECVRRANENPDLIKLIEEWMTYKDEKKPKTSNHYDSELGIIRLIGKFVSEVDDYGMDAVREVVHTTMASNYMGVVWDTLEKQKRRPVGGKKIDEHKFDLEVWEHEEG